MYPTRSAAGTAQCKYKVHLPTVALALKLAFLVSCLSFCPHNASMDASVVLLLRVCSTPPITRLLLANLSTM